MKKVIILLIIIFGGYFGWRYLPASAREAIGNGAAKIGLNRLSPSNFLPPLKAGIEPLAKKILPENHAETRAALIGNLSKELEIIETHANPKTPAEKQKLEAAIQKSNQTISALKAENTKGGIISDAITSFFTNPSTTMAVSCVK